METFIFAWFGVGLIIGFFCAFIAKEKHRGGFGWFVLGLLFGLFALIAIAAVPGLEKQESEKKEPEIDLAHPEDPPLGVMFLISLLIVSAIIYVVFFVFGGK